MGAIMDAEVSTRVGAEHGERSPDRPTHRNGYRSRTWDTRGGIMVLHIRKLREESGISPMVLLTPSESQMSPRPTNLWPDAIAATW